MRFDVRGTRKGGRLKAAAAARSVSRSERSQGHTRLIVRSAAEPDAPRRAPPPPIGGKLQAIRKGRNLTLGQVEALSGISKSMLSQMERGKVNPTYATLWHLTQSLDIDMGELLEKAKSAAGKTRAIEHVKVYSTPTITSPDGKCNVRILSPRRFPLPIEWYEMIFAPGGSIRANAHGNGAWEHLTVVEGRLIVEIGDDDVVLEEGETVRYSAEQPHGARNEGPRRAKALMVLVALDEIEPGRHFRDDDQ